MSDEKTQVVGNYGSQNKETQMEPVTPSTETQHPVAKALREHQPFGGWWLNPTLVHARSLCDMIEALPAHEDQTRLISHASAVAHALQGFLMDGHYHWPEVSRPADNAAARYVCATCGSATNGTTQCPRCVEHDRSLMYIAELEAEIAFYRRRDPSAMAAYAADELQEASDAKASSTEREIAAFEDKLRIKGQLIESADISFHHRVREFIDKHGRNGAKTGRADYTKMIGLDEIEAIRVALDEYDRVTRYEIASRTQTNNTTKS
jgi:rubrerythrin